MGRARAIISLHAERDASGWPTRIIVDPFAEEIADHFKGTVIEHVKLYGSNDPRRYLDSLPFLHALHRFVGDVQDTPVFFQGERFADQVTTLSHTTNPALGDFEVGWTNGISSHGRRTGSPWTIRRGLGRASADLPHGLESQGRVLMRWPRGVPLTEPRTEATAQEMDGKKWQAMRLAALFQAAAEALRLARPQCLGCRSAAGCFVAPHLQPRSGR